MRPHPRPAFSVIVPSYNYGHYLPDAIRSATAQRDVTLEVIVVDDGSTDDSVEIAQAAASDDPRVTLVSHAANRGLIPTINDGIESANGDLLVVLSADDALAPDALARVAAVFSTHQSVGMVFGRRRQFSESAELRSAWQSWSDQRQLEIGPVSVHAGGRWLDRRCQQGVNLIASPEVAVRASVQRTVGPYSERCRHTSDLNMWLRVSAEFDVAHVGGEPLAWYRRHGANMSATAFSMHDVDALERWVAFDDALGRRPGRASDRRRTRVQRSITRELLHEVRRAGERRVLDHSHSRLIEAAAAIDPNTTRSLVRADGTVRRAALGRLLRRWRWRRWLVQWDQRGI